MILLFIVSLVVGAIIIGGILVAKRSGNIVNSDEIPEGYIAVFHGGSGEQTYETYIYKINNEQENYGFEYINTTSTTTYWGSGKQNIKITKRGSVDWTDKVFVVAKENNAYSFVTLPNSDKIYTIEEYMQIFLMN